jgi:methionyl-tRNA formyltransferase
LAAEAVEATPGIPGTLTDLVVATGDGGLRLDLVQPEGKRPMSAVEWRRGLRAADDVHLGREADL